MHVEELDEWAWLLGRLEDWLLRASEETAQDHLIAIGEVAQLLGVEVRHVRRLVHERRIPFIKWGHLLRFDPGDIEAWVDSHRHGGGLTPPVRLASHRRPALADPPRDS